MLVKKAGSIELEPLANWTAFTVAASGYGFGGNLLRICLLCVKYGCQYVFYEV